MTTESLRRRYAGCSMEGYGHRTVKAETWTGSGCPINAWLKKRRPGGGQSSL